MTWTQPFCAHCWAQDNPGREPVRIPGGDLEQCCKCGGATRAGIYVRVDPKTVPYPQGN